MTQSDRKNTVVNRPWYPPSLTTQILIGLVIGGLLGYLSPKWGNNVYFLRDIFLNLIKSIIAPLIFSTLVVGIAGGGDLKKVGRMGVKALLYFEIVTTIALFIGLGIVNLTKPGAGVALAGGGDISQLVKTQPQGFRDLLVHINQSLKAVREPFPIGFATTSSECALPKAMENMERLGFPRRIVGFVMPTGYSFNLDGTTLYLAIASVFVAQAAEPTIGHMNFGRQLFMMLTLMITSKGVAGVPRAALVILLATLNSFMPGGLGPIGVAVIFGVDELMDMGRTSVNVLGNCLATVVVARWEGEFDDNRARIFGTPAEARLDLKEGELAFAESAEAD